LPEDGTRLITEVAGREIAVFRIDGSYHALLNYCVHEAGPLCEGPLEGELGTDEDDEWIWTYDDAPSIVACPWHAWKFDIETGKNLQNDRYSVPTYEVEVTDDGVFIVL
jgi:nitrite reductase/ring-hydroxylating ferredoxin subunit